MPAPPDVFWPTALINGQLCVRGHGRDYDEWTQIGCRGGSFDDVLPCFRKSGNWKGPGNVRRGTGGPLGTVPGRDDNPLYIALIKAGRELGNLVTNDCNGTRQQGFGLSQYTHDHSFPLRHSASNAYLMPARRRRNITVVTGARVLKLCVEDKYCT
ncbi:MAG: GMC family oxidoreductase N-terminal domain-containing protein [Rhodospirillales bacterium]|nr:GMC family oxidoreductase N-terminal domain-containing protein [Rhodospirillales bacterium]